MYSRGMRYLYGLIERRERRGNDLIGYLCLMLTNDWKMKRESGYVNEIMEWRNNENKGSGMNCLRILYLNVYGMEMKRKRSAHDATYKIVSTGRRMREVWKDEGKENEEGRREWERIWREAGDIMNEEDVMETSIMHLCIPDDIQKKEEDGLILPSWCSYSALRILLNEKVQWRCAYHFSEYDVNDELSNVVIIRNLPSRYPNSALTDMIEQVSKVVSIEEQRRVCRIKLRTTHGARKVVEALNGREFYGKKLSVSEGRKNWILGLFFFLFLSSSISLSISLLPYSFCSLFSIPYSLFL